jgi:hypothetical protein
MTTYTIATINAMLIAVIPDGGDIEAAIRDFEWDYGDKLDRKAIRVTSGCTLTDEIEEGDEVVYRCTEYGYLTDLDGRTYYAAVVRK